MKKKTIIGIVTSIISIFIIGLIVFIFYYNKYDAEKVLKDYVNLINDKKYEEMYSNITEETKEYVTKDYFITRNKNIYEGIEASNIKVSIKNTEKKGDTYVIDYNMSMNTMAGELEFNNTVNIIKEKGIEWGSELIYPSLSADDKIRVETETSKRGEILDRNGNILAGEGIDAHVGLVPGKMNEDTSGDIKKISEILGVSEEYINNQLNLSWVTDDTFVPIKEIPSGDSRIQELLQIKGILINDKKVRVYPLGEKAAHLTGYVQAVTAEDIEKNPDKGYTESSIIGKSGLEKIYEDRLEGKNGVKIYILDKEGNIKEEILNQEVKNGEDIKLTIDINLQESLYNEFINDKSAGVAMNSNTGEVLALVSTPSYNPNDFVMGISNSEWERLNNDENLPFFNRFQHTVVPGSVFKPIVAGLALENRSLDINEKKNITGLKWQKDSSWGDYYVTRVSDYGGDTNLMNALVYSDNIYFAQVALDIGKDNMASLLNNIGFNEKIPFEYGLYNSTFDEEEKISTEIQLADTGYGQGEILMNPIHLSSIYTAFINDGNMMTPYLELSLEPKVWKNQVFSSENAKIVLDDMIQVVENPNGTGHESKINGLEIAGKTGTGEIKSSQNDTNGTEVGWFVGMTTNTESNIIIAAMVEDVKDRGGSHYLVPKVKTVIDNYYK